MATTVAMDAFYGDVILLSGICWEFIETQNIAPTHSNPAAVFPDCATCATGSSSSLSSASSSNSSNSSSSSSISSSNSSSSSDSSDSSATVFNGYVYQLCGESSSSSLSSSLSSNSSSNSSDSSASSLSSNSSSSSNSSESSASSLSSDSSSSSNSSSLSSSSESSGAPALVACGTPNADPAIEITVAGIVNGTSWLNCTWDNNETKLVYSDFYNNNASIENWNRLGAGADNVYLYDAAIGGSPDFPPDGDGARIVIAWDASNRLDLQSSNQYGSNDGSNNVSSTDLTLGDLSPGAPVEITSAMFGTVTFNNGVTVTISQGTGNGW